MKFKNENDARYIVNFMPSTESIIKSLSTKEFIKYLDENAEFEDYTYEWIDGHAVKCKAYIFNETENLNKEFLVTENGRVFYWLSLINKIEFINDTEKESENKTIKVDNMNEKIKGERTMKNNFKQNITIDELISKVRSLSKSALQEYDQGDLSSAKSYAMCAHEVFRFINIYFMDDIEKWSDSYEWIRKETLVDKIYFLTL
jgi:hypothetical protein